MEKVSLIILISAVAALALYVVAVTDLIRNRKRFRTLGLHGLWLAVVVLFPVIGAVAWLLLRKQIIQNVLQPGA